jgi:hypothetical protein
MSHSSICAKCGKPLPRGLRRKIYGAPKLARFCTDCWISWLAGFWKMHSVFPFANGGFYMPNVKVDQTQNARKGENA